MILRGRGCHCLKEGTRLWASRGKSFGLRKWGFALRFPRQHRERFHFVLAAVAAVATVVGAAAVAVVQGKSMLDGLTVGFVQMILVRRRFGGSTKRVKTFVAPMGMKAP